MEIVAKQNVEPTQNPMKVRVFWMNSDESL